MFARTLLILVIVVAIGCEQTRRPSAGEMAIVFGGAQSLDTIKASTDVTAYRLPTNSYNRAKLAEYKMLSGPISLSSDKQARVRSILLDLAMYGGPTKGCVPDYGVRFQFRHNGKDVDVLLCFRCDILGVYVDGDTTGRIEYFTPGRTQFITLVKELFPDDADIASLQ